ncbi:hypothetical protein UT300009_30060 [Paraclostridium bifermentans]
MARVNYIVETPLDNYYGNMDVIELDGEHYITLDDWEVTRAMKISAELAELMKKELEDKTSKDIYILRYGENGTKAIKRG